MKLHTIWHTQQNIVYSIYIVYAHTNQCQHK